MIFAVFITQIPVRVVRHMQLPIVIVP